MLYWIRHIQNTSGIFNTVFSGVGRHIQAYSALLRDIHSCWDIIKAYSAPCVTLAYSQPWHILSPGIFITGGLFKTLWNADQAYSEHSGHYSAIFKNTENLVQRLHKQKPDIFGILEYSKILPKSYPNTFSKPCHIYENLQIFRDLTYLKPDTYAESSQRFKIYLFFQSAPS